jgi:hypothetical protein
MFTPSILSKCSKPHQPHCMLDKSKGRRTPHTRSVWCEYCITVVWREEGGARRDGEWLYTVYPSATVVITLVLLYSTIGPLLKHTWHTYYCPLHRWHMETNWRQSVSSGRLECALFFGVVWMHLQIDPLRLNTSTTSVIYWHLGVSIQKNQKYDWTSGGIYLWQSVNIRICAGCVLLYLGGLNSYKSIGLCQDLKLFSYLCFLPFKVQLFLWLCGI